MSDALTSKIARYANAVRSSDAGNLRVRSATFWLSLGVDRNEASDLALIHDAFRTHGIVVSTSDGELGHEPADAWIELTNTPRPSEHGTSIRHLPDSLFGDAPELVGQQAVDTMAGEHQAGPSTVFDPPAFTRSSGNTLHEPGMTTITGMARPRQDTWEAGSSDSATWVRCPACGATVLQSALFCPVCSLPQTNVDEQARLVAATTGAAYPAVNDRVRIEGWPPPATRRQRVQLPREASVVIGLVVLAVGSRLGNLLMPLLVAGALVLLGISVWKPDILGTLFGRRTSQPRVSLAAGAILQIAVVVAVIVAMYLMSPGTAMFDATSRILVP